MQNLLHSLHRGLNFVSPLDPSQKKNDKSYDPEMIYVECRVCGNPVMWEPGRTTAILLHSQINPDSVDAFCLILTEGCKKCKPGAPEYPLSMIRLSDITPQELLGLYKPGGHA